VGEAGADDGAGAPVFDDSDALDFVAESVEVFCDLPSPEADASLGAFPSPDDLPSLDDPPSADDFGLALP